MSRTICVLVVLCAVVLVDLYYGANAAGLGDPRAAWVRTRSLLAARTSTATGYAEILPTNMRLFCTALALRVAHLVVAPLSTQITVASLKKKMHQTG